MDLTKGLALATRLTRAAVMKRSFLNCLWELTYRCDAQCAMCGYWRRDAPVADEQKTTEICRGLELVAEAGCRAVNFTGGEPTLRDDLEDIVAHAARQGMWVSLVTNGLSLDRSRVRGLREAGLHNLFVSLDAADPVVHDGQRGVEGAYERTLAAVGLLGDAFVGGCRTAGIMTVVTRRNERGLPQLIDLAAGARVRLVVQPHHRRVDDDLAPECIRRAVEDLLGHPRRRGVLLNTRRYLERMSAFDEQERPRDCHAGRKYFSVDPYGGIHPCVDLPRVGHVLEAGLAALRSSAVREEVAACRGCWYCFRGEADGMLTLGGYAQKLALASGVYLRNVGRPPAGGERGSDLRAGASPR